MSPGGRRSAVDRIDADVRRAIGQVGPVPGMAEVVRAWTTAVGAVVARNAWPARLARDGTLHVATSSATWALELTLLEETMLLKLRQVLEGTPPGRIRFAPGVVPDLRSQDDGHGPEAVAPDAADVGQAAELTAGIEDDELRRLVARAAAASLARGHSDRAV